jgi:hypothetical protein
VKAALTAATIAKAQASLKKKVEAQEELLNLSPRDQEVIERFIQSPLFQGLLAQREQKVAAEVGRRTLAARIRGASFEEKAIIAAEVEKAVEVRLRERLAAAIEPYEKALEELSTAMRSMQKSAELDFAKIAGDLAFIKAMPVPGGPLVRRVPGLQTGPRVKQPSPEQKAAQLRVDELERQLAWASPVQKSDINRSLEFARALLRQS